MCSQHDDPTYLEALEEAERRHERTRGELTERIHAAAHPSPVEDCDLCYLSDPATVQQRLEALIQAAER